MCGQCVSLCAGAKMSGDVGPGLVGLGCRVAGAGAGASAGSSQSVERCCSAQSGIFLLLQFLAMRYQAAVSLDCVTQWFGTIPTLPASPLCHSPVKCPDLPRVVLIYLVSARDHRSSRHPTQPRDTQHTPSARYSKLSTPSPRFQHGHPTPRSPRRNPCSHPLIPASSRHHRLQTFVLAAAWCHQAVRTIAMPNTNHEKLHRRPFSPRSLDFRLLGEFKEVGEGLADFWSRKGGCCANHIYPLPRSQRLSVAVRVSHRDAPW